jgi:alanyl-tRNA synthetase
VPENDKSLLIINSGMAPLKPFFAGLEQPPSKRMTTCQKCIRTGDLENVGHTSRHGTFFEMLGNFSFGDYFKRESLTWGWEFITQNLEMPVDKLWATIYEDDEEAYDIWINDIGIAPERVVRLGKDDNFWEIGTGPCGPCSEIYFDRGEKYGCGKEDCKPGCDCDRYVEFWNHVFTQFNRDDAGNYTPLPHPNIDTGMGLERLACIMQDTDSIFDIDTIRHILTGVTEISGVAYEDGQAATDVSVRIITDHIRSVTFMIADGIIPSNVERGYVLRRLLRRAGVHGRKLGIKRLFLTELADRVIEVSGKAYPELVEKAAYIKKMIRIEEEKFAATVEQGYEMLNGYIEELSGLEERVLSGKTVFKLYDTHGFHPELTREILEEHGIDIDEEGFERELERQRETSRQNMKVAESAAWAEDEQIFAELPKTTFEGYEQLQGGATVLRIFADGAEADAAYEGASVLFVLDRTPFYAESGGQAGDKGDITGDDGAYAVVTDVKKVRGVFLHEALVRGGVFKAGDQVRCSVNVANRYRTARNHTATHLLHKALRQVLGDHVQQAGSFVNAQSLRFDFSHYEGIGEQQLAEVEAIVNSVIDEFQPVTVSECALAEAKQKGAMALFDEKYGDTVRVVEVGDFSIELCGGTHVKSSGEIGAFKIESESSVGSGTRRIEAITGTNILSPLDKAETYLKEIGDVVKSHPDYILERVNGLLADMKDIKKELEAAKQDQMKSSAGDLLAGAKQIGPAKLVTQVFDEYTAEDLRGLCDDIRGTEKDVILALASRTDGKVIFIVAVSDHLQEAGYHAGKIVKEMAAAAGGGGGGKADMAQAGAKDVSKVEAAMAAAVRAVSEV